MRRSAESFGLGCIDGSHRSNASNRFDGVSISPCGIVGLSLISSSRLGLKRPVPALLPSSFRSIFSMLSISMCSASCFLRRVGDSTSTASPAVGGRGGLRPSLCVRRSRVPASSSSASRPSLLLPGDGLLLGDVCCAHPLSPYVDLMTSLIRTFSTLSS